MAASARPTITATAIMMRRAAFLCNLSHRNSYRTCHFDADSGLRMITCREHSWSREKLAGGKRIAHARLGWHVHSKCRTKVLWEDCGSDLTSEITTILSGVPRALYLKRITDVPTPHRSATFANMGRRLATPQSFLLCARDRLGESRS